MGIKPGQITNLLKGGNPSETLLMLLAMKYSVNEEWLRTGIGEQFVPGKISLIRIEPQPSLGELIRAAEEILISDTDYGKALAQNIRTFHRGYLLEKREFRLADKDGEDHDVGPQDESLSRQ